MLSYDSGLETTHFLGKTLVQVPFLRRLFCFFTTDISKLQGNLSVGKPQIIQSKLQLTLKLFSHE